MTLTDLQREHGRTSSHLFFLIRHLSQALPTLKRLRRRTLHDLSSRHSLVCTSEDEESLVGLGIELERVV